MLHTQIGTVALFITELFSAALFIAVLLIVIQRINMNIFLHASAQKATFKVNKITLRTFFSFVFFLFLYKE